MALLSLLLLLLSLGLVQSAPISNPFDQTVTLDQVHQGCSRVVSNSHVKEYLPNDVYEEIAGTCSDDNELNALVGLHNKISSGEIEAPKTSDDAMTILEQEAPLTYNRITTLQQAFQKNISQLAPKAKKFLTDMGTDFSSTPTNKNMKQQAVAQVKKFLTWYNNYQALDSNTKQNLTNTWPTAGAILDNNKVKMAIGMLNNIPKNKLQSTLTSYMSIYQSMQNSPQRGAFARSGTSSANVHAQVMPVAVQPDVASEGDAQTMTANV